MLRHRRAQGVVHAKERVDEVAAVQQVHRQVPDARDGEEQHEAADHVAAQQHAEAALPGEEDEDDEARQRKADGSLRQHRDSSRRKGQVVVAALARLIALIEAHERQADRHPERHIRDDCMAKVPVLDRQRQQHRSAKTRAAAVELRAEAIRHEYANDGKECRKQARSEVRHAEELEGRDELPVKQDGLIVPVIPEDARRQVIPRRDHLLGRLHIIRFHRVRHRHQPVAEQEQHQSKNAQIQQVLAFHRIPP